MNQTVVCEATSKEVCTKDEAHRRRAQLIRDTGHVTEAFHCEHCGGWHLGTRSLRQRPAWLRRTSRRNGRKRS